MAMVVSDGGCFLGRFVYLSNDSCLFLCSCWIRGYFALSFRLFWLWLNRLRLGFQTTVVVVATIAAVTTLSVVTSGSWVLLLPVKSSVSDGYTIPSVMDDSGSGITSSSSGESEGGEQLR